MTKKVHRSHTCALPGDPAPHWAIIYSGGTHNTGITIYGFRPNELFSGHPNIADVCTHLCSAGYRPLSTQMRDWLQASPPVITNIKTPCLIIPEQLTPTSSGQKRNIPEAKVFIIWEIMRHARLTEWTRLSKSERGDYCRFTRHDLIVVWRTTL